MNKYQKNMKRISIIIDPCCNILYASYYIYGLFEIYKSSDIHFSSKPFKGLTHDKHTFCLPFVIEDKRGGTRYCLDMSDSNECVYTSFYNWCDVYGKVNYNTAIHSGLSKIKPIAPNFSIKLWNKPSCLFHATINYLRAKGRVSFSYRDFWRVYASTLKRKRIDEIVYDHRHTDERYIFMVGRWWSGQNECNAARAKFIEVCKSIDSVSFEGGLVPEIGCVENVSFPSLKKYSYEEYLVNTAKSLIVFNTPAYYRCHGWKLPEFLCLGKAIISMPFANELPEPLTHGKNIWFVKDENEIKDAIIMLLENVSLRNKLEHGAREYWEQYCSPVNALKRFIGNYNNV